MGQQNFTDVLENRAPRAARDMTLINAAAALLAAGIVDDLRGGCSRTICLDLWRGTRNFCQPCSNFW